MVYSSSVFWRLFAWCIALLVVHPEHGLGIAWLHRRKVIQIKFWDIVMLLVMHDAYQVVVRAHWILASGSYRFSGGHGHPLNLCDDLWFTKPEVANCDLKWSGTKENWDNCSKAMDS